jgi:flagellar biosynthetic protein FlhB
MDLSLFSSDKTEKATPKKKSKAREEGQVARSSEISTAILFLAAFTALRVFSGFMLERALRLFGFGMSLIEDVDAVFDMGYVARIVSSMMAEALIVSAPIFAASMAVGVAANLAQVGWHVTTKPLKPKFSHMNPISGLKRLFSTQALVNFAKSVVKFAIIVSVIWNIVEEEIQKLPLLAGMDIMESASVIGGIVIRMGLNAGGWFVFIAAADYAFVRFKHSKSLRMSKQEIKEEIKMSEGNPQVKGKIKSKMRESSMRRMMSAVPHADVIITNPTRYAVALRYDRGSKEAPQVCAKGVDYLALRIREAAKESGVQIVENRELARTLYAQVEVGEEIPQELYQAVAEILAFVYRMKPV